MHSFLTRFVRLVPAVAFPALLAGAPAERIAPLDKMTVAVTDLTEAGRQLPIPSPQQPVYYIGLNAGFQLYTGITMANDEPPPERAMLRIIAQVLAEQGFLAADATHAPTQIVVCSWGVLGTSGPNLFGPGPGIGFLGGEKMNLIEDTTIPGHISADFFRRRFRSGAAETVLSMSQDNLYAVLLRSYDFPAAEAGRIVQLWETRIACTSPGTNLAKALPRIVVSGQHAIGRETPLPIVQNFARTRHAWVEIGESTVVDYIDVADLLEAKAEARQKRAESAPAGTKPPTSRPAE